MQAHRRVAPRALGSHNLAAARLSVVRHAVATVAPPVANVKQDAVPRGETAGAMLVLEEGAINVQDRDLLVDAEWRVVSGAAQAF